MFNAIVLTREERSTRVELARLDESQLPDGEVDVAYSTLSYKDALAIAGRGASHGAAYLRFLGATTIVDRNELPAPGRVVKQVTRPATSALPEPNGETAEWAPRAGQPASGYALRGLSRAPTQGATAQYFGKNPKKRMEFVTDRMHPIHP